MIHLIVLLSQIVSRVVDVYSMLILVYALLSWFPGAYQSTLGKWVIALTGPYIDLFRRFNLRFAGLDFSVMLALIALRFIEYAIQRFLVIFLIW